MFNMNWQRGYYGSSHILFCIWLGCFFCLNFCCSAGESYSRWQTGGVSGTRTSSCLGWTEVLTVQEQLDIPFLMCSLEPLLCFGAHKKSDFIPFLFSFLLLCECLCKIGEFEKRKQFSFWVNSESGVHIEYLDNTGCLLDCAASSVGY